MEDKVAEGLKTSLGFFWSYEVYGGTYNGIILYKPVPLYWAHNFSPYHALDLSKDLFHQMKKKPL